jgi:hypothetical protein
MLSALFFPGWGKEMAKRDIMDIVCKPFCSFFREGVKEELICNGARLLEMLMAKGVLSPYASGGVKSLPGPEYGRNSLLESAVCRRCSFRMDDCDFQSESPPPGAEPCGGYILLALLAAKSVVSPEELSEIADG